MNKNIKMVGTVVLLSATLMGTVFAEGAEANNDTFIESDHVSGQTPIYKDPNKEKKEPSYVPSDLGRRETPKEVQIPKEVQPEVKNPTPSEVKPKPVVEKPKVVIEQPKPSEPAKQEQKKKVNKENKETKEDKKKEKKKKVNKSESFKKIEKENNNLSEKESNPQQENTNPVQNENNSDNNVEPNNTEEQTGQNSQETNTPVEEVKPGSMFTSDYIASKNIIAEMRRIEDRRSRILDMCDKNDTQLMSRIFFELYLNRLGDRDVTHYESLSPIIYNKKTGNKSQYITNAELAMYLDSIYKLVTKDNSNTDSIPMLDTKDTIFESSVSNMINKGVISNPDFIVYNSYNLVTWGEFKSSIERLYKVVLTNSNNMSINNSNEFKERFIELYSNNIDDDVYISKSMSVTILRDLMFQLAEKNNIPLFNLGGEK